MRATLKHETLDSRMFISSKMAKKIDGRGGNAQRGRQEFTSTTEALREKIQESLDPKQ